MSTRRITMPITRRLIALLTMLTCLAVTGRASAQAGADHPLVGRYEGSELVGHTHAGFDEVELIDGPIVGPTHGVGAAGWMHVEGSADLYYYKLPDDRSSLEVLRNYEDSLKAKGFATVFSCATSNGSCYEAKTGHTAGTAPYDFANALDASPELPRLGGDYIRNYFGTNARYLLAKSAQPEGTVYASIAFAEGNRGNYAFVRVVQTRDMDAGKIAFVGAEQMQKAIADAGRISLYGIQFDFDKDVVKPESLPTLDEIVRLLKVDPSLRLNVVGHTDGKGSVEYNIDLSRRRAQAVVAELVQRHGIDTARLSARGAGAGEPLAPNDSEENRARNRRVELVKR
jgi:outer membrane protein OmpA-like peptidoglycan-associated protein